MIHTFTIKGRLPGLNDYLKAERSFHKKYSLGNEMKRDCQFLINNAIRTQLKRLTINTSVTLNYRFFEPNTRRDLDNISAVAHKFIQDSLVECKVLKNDGWKEISGFTDTFFVDKDNPRIEVDIIK